LASPIPFDRESVGAAGGGGGVVELGSVVKPSLQKQTKQLLPHFKEAQVKKQPHPSMPARSSPRKVVHDAAATTMQKAARGYKARRVSDGKRHAQEVQQGAAVKMQAVGRIN
jgi:hypothetical protein